MRHLWEVISIRKFLRTKESGANFRTNGGANRYSPILDGATVINSEESLVCGGQQTKAAEYEICPNRFSGLLEGGTRLPE